ncbi:MAG: class I SAM-dependent methyltransferase [Candidatus Omnitrophica bacterium]|nr:class I SAM-dependent methyltransferase [Candidatus Omnitrophota bacterium]
MNILSHYYNLVHFAFNRFRGDNYRLMREYFAGIFISEVEGFLKLTDKMTVLDVGGARGEFSRMINEKRGCKVVNLDPVPGESVWPDTVTAVGDRIPFRDGQFDLAMSRGVLEHIPRDRQQLTIDEIYRVLRKGGYAYIMIPPWYNPFAGHGLKPFHTLPFPVAKRLREFFFRKKVKGNSFAEKRLFPITFRRARNMLKKSGFEIKDTLDTHFRLHFLTKIPVLREILVPAAAFILKKE